MLQEHRSIRTENQPSFAEQGQISHAAISISADGKLVASYQNPGQVTVWDAMSGRILAKRTGFFGGVHTLEMSPDGRYVAFATMDGAYLWDWIDQRIVWSEGRHHSVQSFAIDSQRKRFYMPGWRVLRIHSLENGAELGRIPLGDVDVQSAKVLDSGEVLLLCKKTGILHVDPEAKQVTARVDGGYPKIQLFSKDQIDQRPELAKATKVEGGAFWDIDSAGKRLIIEMRGCKNPWIKLAATSDAALPPEIHLPESPSYLRWLGSSGKLVTLADGGLEFIDPARPAERLPLPVKLPREIGHRALDADQRGGTIVVASSMGWQCYEGDPANPGSWRERIMQDAPIPYQVLDFHPEGTRMIHGGNRGVLWSTSLSGQVETKQQFIVGAPVEEAASFPDGTLIAAGRSTYYLSRNEKLGASIDGIATDTGLRSFGDYFLARGTDPKSLEKNLGVMDSAGNISATLPLSTYPALHESLPVFIRFTPEKTRVCYQVSEITGEGKCVTLHDRELKAGSTLPIVESRDSFLVVQSGKTLARVNAATAAVTPLRGDMPGQVDEGHLHPSGDRLFLIRYPGTVAPLIFPLAPERPGTELTPMTGTSWSDNADWLGFTRNGKGLWLRMEDGSAGLWDCETGKAVAGFKAYEDGGAIVFLPDGRCAFSEQARGRAFLRKSGSTELILAESTPAVLEVLALYLQLP